MTMEKGKQQKKKESDCPKFDSDEWKELNASRKEVCKKERLVGNTTKFLTFNSLNMVIIAVIGGFALALALMIIEPIQAQFTGYEIYWFALGLFGIIIIFAFIQYKIEKQKNYYEQQL